jgi:biopolymer transport protein ExbB
MLEPALNLLREVAQRGGWVIWPLGALSVLGLTLIFERFWFFLSTNSPWRRARFREVGRHLREGRRDRAWQLVARDRSVYGRIVHRMVEEGADDAVAAEALESQRHRLERFMPTLGTIITAAPMLGILGTVTGIISAFRVLSDQTVTDPSEVGSGIAEALLTTVVGLVVALIVLFPYNSFRAQIDRTLGRMEALVTAAQQKGPSETEGAFTEQQ